MADRPIVTATSLTPRQTFMDPKIKHILARFDIHPQSIERVNSGGFSGAAVWRVKGVKGVKGAAGDSFSLKRSPESAVSPQHLQWIHQVIVHAHTVCDCQFLACPLPADSTSGSATSPSQGPLQRFIHSDGWIWEASPWMNGTADFSDQPTDERLIDLMQSLAKFHRSAAQVNLDIRPSPNLPTRISMLRSLVTNIAKIDLEQSHREGLPALWYLLRLMKTIPANHIQQLLAMLEPLGDQPLPLQPVIRDLWHDHLFFTGNRLSGIIDFDAMQMDSIAYDLSRLLGSLVPDQPDRWRIALEAYSKIRPLQQPELDLLIALDSVNPLLSAFHWIQWIVVDGRSFENLAEVEKRLLALLKRLQIQGGLLRD